MIGTAKAHAQPEIAFLSDLEGSEAKLRDFLARHPAFEDGRLAGGAAFVHGGDVPDRFPGGFFVVDELLRMKAELPDRVVLIAGNRDVNKVRLLPELTEAGLAAPPPVKADDWPTWLAGRPPTRANRLRWILERTMGAPAAFEMRRLDLGKDPAAGDEEVVESFLQDLGPGGRFRRLLRASRLLHRVGNTLFCHAGITEDCLGYVPGEPRARDLEDWIVRLDRWYQAQLDEWEAGALDWTGAGPRAGEELVRYCEPDPGESSNPRSVLYCRHIDTSAKIALPPLAVTRFLLDAGIERLAIGHTPSGQAPVVLRREDDRFELLLSDNSHGAEPERTSLVTIRGPDQRTVSIDSFVPVGARRVPLAFDSVLGIESPLGKRLPDGSVIIAPTPRGFITYQMHPGWRVEYREIPAAVALSLVAGPG